MIDLWQRIKTKANRHKRPIFVQAPMANVTDPAFRAIIAKWSKIGKRGSTLDALWTEFVSADGLANEKARKILLKDLKFSENERPIIAQLFTGHPDKMRQAAKLTAKLGFDGIDINMGCPDRAVEKQGGGASLMKDKEKALEIINATRAGVKDAGKNIPVSVKTRIGYNKEEIDSWVTFLLEQKLPLISIHLRTRKEMSEVPAHWELMPKIVQLRDKISPETLIIGNGDIKSIEQGFEKCKETGCDGVMIGRGIFGNPWFYLNKDIEDIKTKDRLKVLIEHIKVFNKLLGKEKNFAIMKKHFKAYISGWTGAKDVRMKLMETNNAREAEKILKGYLK